MIRTEAPARVEATAPLATPTSAPTAPPPVAADAAGAGAAAPPLARGVLFLFWAPLAAQWLMMSAEGPFLAAIIARAGEPLFNLAAYGVAYAFAILTESPVIMLMSASIALVEDAASYRRLRAFAWALNLGATALLLLVLLPPVYYGLMVRLLGLPAPVVALVRGALWLLLPWPAAIGYRRFLHGLLIRAGLTRRVAYGTILRLTSMALVAALLYAQGALPGAWVGAAALSAGVCVEALAARFMAAGVVRGLLAGEGAGEGPLAPAPGYGEIARFYLPLALTSLIGLTVHPLLTFFMGRAPAPVESLAVFPVVHSLGFLFRAPAFAFQETVIALSGRRFEQVRPLARFGAGIALVTTAGLVLVAFTPLAGLWFETVSGLAPRLAAVALAPTRILVLLPAVGVLSAFLQGVLVQGRSTRAISAASALEVGTIGVLFVLFGWQLGLTGVSAAMLALVGGRALATAWLLRPARRVLSGVPARVAAG